MATAKTDYKRIGRDLAEFAVRRHGLDRQSACLDLATLANTFVVENGWPVPLIEPGSDEARIYYKNVFPHFSGHLWRRYRTNVVKASSALGRLVKHGESPDRDDKVRTDAAYKKCLPASRHASWVVAFATGQHADHPLITKKLATRIATTQTWAKNTVLMAADAHSNGNLSVAAKNSVVASIADSARKAIEPPPAEPQVVRSIPFSQTG